MASPFDLFTEAPAGASSTPTQPQQPSRFDAFVGAGDQDLTKPSFLIRKQPAKALEARAVEVRAEEAKQTPFKDLYQDDAKFKTVYEYANARFGKEGDMKDGETREDYIGRWASHMRMTTQNFTSGGMELAYLNNASEKDLLKARNAYDVWDNTAGYFNEKGGQAGVKPVIDALSTMVDIPTVATLGVGKVATSVFMKTAAKEGLRSAITKRLATLAAVPATEGVFGAATNTIEQKRNLTVDAARLKEIKKAVESLSEEERAPFQPEIDDLEAKQKAGVSGAQAAVAGAIGAIGGTLETGALVAAARKINKTGASNELEDILQPRRDKFAKEGTLPKIEVKAVDPTEKALEDAYDIFEGRKLLNAQGDPTSVAEMQIRNDVNKKATEIAGEIWKRVPDLAPAADQKVSDAVKNVFMNIDQIDDVVLQDSLAKAGITPEEFARMNRTTVGDAGRTLQSYSVLARLQNKLKSIDPAAAKQVDEMYGNRNAITSSFVGLRNFGMRLDRELKALMVSQVATTIRNGFSGAAVVTFGTASEAIESSLYRMGKTVGELATGKPITGSFTGGLKGVYDDAVRTTFYLGQTDLSSDVAERLLAGSPKLHEMIIKTAGEAGNERLSKIGQIANTLNVAQDSFFRKAIFTASVEKQLSRAGIDMYDVMAQGKTVPFDVLKNATDEALTATFSKMPTKGPMFHAVKFIEELGPIGSTFIPFPRFMANAMTWTYKHSPMGIFSGAADIAAGAAKQVKGDVAGVGQTMQGLENVSKGMVGTAAIYAAYKYREENQDTPWYDIKNPDGSLVDARALFPAAPFLAMGDYLVKFNKGRTDEFKTKEFLEAMTGFKAPAGTYSWLGDKFAEASSNMQTGDASADTKVSTFFGEWMGEYLGRALVPVQQISDIIGAIDRDETLPRDAYQIAPGKEGAVASAVMQLGKRTPVIKQMLPVYQPATREEAAFNDSGILKIFSGITIKGKPTPLEEEITRLKIPFNKIFTSTGDKIVDAAARKVMAPLLLQTYEVVKNTDWYQNSSQDVQKIALQNTLAFAQKNAKEIATNQAQAEAFNKGEQARIFAVKYSALPPEVKRATAEMYEQQTGKKLEETKAYLEALSYAAAIRKQPGFAGGGLASDIASRIVGTTVKRSSSELLQDIQAAVAKKKLSQQTDEAIPTTKSTVSTPTEAPKTISKAINPAEVAPSKPSAFDAFVEAPVVSGNKAIDAPVTETPTAFSEYQMQEAEKLLTSKMGSKYQVDAYKKSDPDAYQTSLNKLAGEVEPAAKVESVMSATKATKEAKQVDLPPEQQTVENTSLNKPKFASTVERLNNTMSQLRDIRTQAFDTLKESPLITEKGISEDALAVAQGDWRMKTKTELNVNDPREVQEFATFAEGYQKKLEALREKYKDRPPEILYHGKDTERTPAKIKRGFLKPQDFDAKHIELGIPAPSFTRDLRLNYNTPDFGGVYPKNISQTEIPFADYLFRRVDMSLDAYKLRDKDVMAQTITGSPTIARPLGLPRSFGYRESEDAFVEADKLVMKTDFDTVRKKYKQFDIQDKIKNKIWDKLGKDRKALQYLIGDKQELAAANTAYGNIRDLFKNEMIDTGTEKAAKSSLTLPSTGSSQTMLKRFELLSRNPDLDLIPLIDDTIDALNRSGVKDKSLVLKDLRNQLKVLKQDVPTELPKEKEDILQRNKAVNTIRELIGGERKIPARLTDSEGPASQYPKNIKRLGLAKGGLASRR